MTEIAALDIGRHALLTGLQLSAPLLIASLVTGVLVSILLAATQVQEFTLTFVPKIVAVAVAGFVFGPWMLRVMLQYAERVLSSMGSVVP
jgi:flagellar biosynthetic protein FliQ